MAIDPSQFYKDTRSVQELAQAILDAPYSGESFRGKKGLGWGKWVIQMSAGMEGAMTVHVAEGRMTEREAQSASPRLLSQIRLVDAKRFKDKMGELPSHEAEKIKEKLRELIL